MTHCNTALHFVPRHEIESSGKQHYQAHTFRSTSRCLQFVTMVFAQLVDRHSLRDVVSSFSN